MDIARTPSTPDGNPHLADAPPEPVRPAIIHRRNYRPFAWTVPQTRLHFDLGLERTRVTAFLQVARNPAAEASQTLRLNGDGRRPLELIIDGHAVDSWVMEGDDLIMILPGKAHEVQIVTEVDPAANTQLMGLYASNGMLCTQCEAEGFRRITFFPDRPDVLSTYTVHMEGDAKLFPVLLSNGNKVAEGAGEDGRHFAEWYDPWPKPSYLFALVAGGLVANQDRFTTMSGSPSGPRYLGPRRRPAAHAARHGLTQALDEVGRGGVRARIRPRRVQHCCGQRLQHGSDGEQGAQRLQHQICAG
jgi:aminopeptidase N